MELSGVEPPHYRGFTITLGHTTTGRTPPINPSQRLLPDNTHNIHNRHTSMLPVGFEPTISASEPPQTHALDCAAKGIGFLVNYEINPGNTGPQNTNTIHLS
jgi:hypothetical protein